jgi:hypothetical protein
LLSYFFLFLLGFIKKKYQNLSFLYAFLKF